MNAPGTTGHRRGNGVDRPRYFDRQLIAAADLSLEQAFGDRRFALFRANVVGWGIAAGLVPTLTPLDGGKGEMTLSVAPGYALTPLGDEVYLDETVTFDDIAALVRMSCGGSAGDCSDVAATVPSKPQSAYAIALAERRRRAERDAAIAAGAAAPSDAVATPCTAWIVASPAPHAGQLRAAMPEGCGHPGNTMQPSRTQGGARVAIVCSLAPPHDSAPPEGEALHALICDAWGPPLDSFAPTANYVVLGRIVLGEGVALDADGRRRIARLDRLSRFACVADRPQPDGTIAFAEPAEGAVLAIVFGQQGVAVGGSFAVSDAGDIRIDLLFDGSATETPVTVDRANGTWATSVMFLTPGPHQFVARIVTLPDGAPLAQATRNVTVRPPTTGTLAIVRPTSGTPVRFIGHADVIVNGSFSVSDGSAVSVLVDWQGGSVAAQVLGNGWGTTLRFGSTGTKPIAVRLIRAGDGVQIAQATTSVVVLFGAVLGPGATGPGTIGTVTVPPLVIDPITNPPPFDPLGPRADEPLAVVLSDILGNATQPAVDRFAAAGVHTTGDLSSLPANSVAALLGVSEVQAGTIVDTAMVRVGVGRTG